MEEYEDQYTTQTQDETGQLVTLMNKDYEEFKQKHGRKRRNPTTEDGTSRDAIKTRTAINWRRWIPGTWKFAEIFAKAGQHEEQTIYGIEKEMLHDPEVLMIQTAGMSEVAKDDIITLADSHNAEWALLSSNNTSKRTLFSGYRRQKEVEQRYTGRLSYKAFIIIVMESVGQILKPDRAQYGVLVKSIVNRVVRLSLKIGRMEKTQGNEYLKEYLARRPRALGAYEAINDKRVTDITKSKRAGDSKAAFDIVVPVPIDYNSMTVVALKVLLKERGLMVSGLKAELVERLQDSETYGGEA